MQWSSPEQHQQSVQHRSQKSILVVLCHGPSYQRIGITLHHLWGGFSITIQQRLMQSCQGPINPWKSFSNKSKAAPDNKLLAPSQLKATPYILEQTPFFIILLTFFVIIIMTISFHIIQQSVSTYGRGHYFLLQFVFKFIHLALSSSRSSASKVLNLLYVYLLS